MPRGNLGCVVLDIEVPGGLVSSAEELNSGENIFPFEGGRLGGEHDSSEISCPHFLFLNYNCKIYY